MYRSIRAMWLSAALAALSGGQALVAQTASPAASGSKERFVTLELDGGKPTRCRVIQSWNDAEGSRCLQVQATASGDRMTVVQKYSSGNLTEVQVYPWNKSVSSPLGVPVPPSTIQQASATAPPKQLPSVDEGKAVPEAKSAPATGTKGDSGKGTKGSSGQGDTGTKGAAKGDPDSGTKGAGMKGAGKGDPDSGTKGAGTKGAGNGDPDNGTKGAGTEGAGNGDPDSGTKGAGTKGDPASGTKGSSGKGVAIVPSSSSPAGKPGDWRQSWGKSEPIAPDAAAMSVKPLPMASRTKPDPLPTVIEAAQSQIAKREAAAERIAKENQKKVVGTETSRTMTKRPNGFLANMGSGGVRFPRAGMGSVAAAGVDPTMLEGFQPPAFSPVPEGMPSVPPGVALSAPQFNGPAVRPIPPRPYTPDKGLGAGMANAFTVPTPLRPIPADFGMPQDQANAFAIAQEAGQGQPPQAYVNPYQPAPAVAMVPQARPYQPSVAAVIPAPTPVADVQAITSTLRDALLPSQREAAAMELANRSYASNPLVISSLVAALQTDPAATVRSSAARALARLGVTREEVVQALRQQRQDSDARVRLEVDNAILKLTSATGR
ncbi:MAG: hypothetical protein NTZ71_12170 [Planctomycetota bacterium]|nr:hypothetical protein [Planctomycetota bacterium]